MVKSQHLAVVDAGIVVVDDDDDEHEHSDDVADNSLKVSWQVKSRE